jgi:hypothetical protein
VIGRDLGSLGLVVRKTVDRRRQHLRVRLGAADHHFAKMRRERVLVEAHGQVAVEQIRGCRRTHGSAAPA